MTSAPTTNSPVAVSAGAAPPPPAHAAPPSLIAGSLPGARVVAGRLLHGTPGRMRLLGLLAVVAALALGAVSANALIASRAAVERAANNTAQVVRAQSLHVELLRADAIATDAFLVGGLESSQTRATYAEAMSRVATGLAEAAAAQPADGRALGALSAQVQTYAALVEQARSTNRLGLPVGAQYLKQASAGLRADAIPIVTEVVKANEQRAREEFDRSSSNLQLLVGVLALSTLAAVAVWLARRTHRYVNRPLSAAFVILAAGLFLAGSTINSIGSATAAVRTGEYRQAVALATVRTAANDARANESLTLIERGPGSASSYEKAWKAQDSAVRTTLGEVDDGDSLLRSWADYTTAHVAVRKLDDSGTWEKAVALSTSTKTDGAAGTFAAFDRQVTSARDGASRVAIDRLDGLGGPAPLWAVVVALAALVSAWLVVRGIGQRIEEYK